MDDEEIVRETLVKMLEYLGYLVIVAGDGEEAIEKFALARESGQPGLTIPVQYSR
jgi:CheY-like chemotaxis protein